MKTETYQDAIEILKAESKKLKEKSEIEKSANLETHSIMCGIFAKFLEDFRKEN